MASRRTNRASQKKDRDFPKSETKLKSLQKKPNHFLECRSYRYHALERIGLFYWGNGKGKGICRISQCTRCGTMREDYYLADGRLMDRRYERPEGYDLEGTGNVLLKDVMREYLARLQSEVAQDRDSFAGSE